MIDFNEEQNKEFHNLVTGKVPGKIHYSSSPDRGLENLLYLLPWIQEKVPGVKLHVDVYYGFENISKMNPELAKKLEALVKTAGGEGVVNFKGRVGQEELAQAWKKASLWFYAAWFSETYCITANEAMLSATPILCSDEAALNTTVGKYGIRVPGYAHSKESREQYLFEAIRLFNDKDHWMHWARMSYAGSLTGIDWESRYNKYWDKLLP